MKLSVEETNRRTGAVVDAAMKVHTILGPGLLESAYVHCLAFEIRKRGFEVVTQYPIPLLYEGMQMEAVYKADLLIDRTVIVEAKAVENLAPIHDAQLLSYLKLSGVRVGLLINFHSLHLKDGIRRRVNDL